MSKATANKAIDFNRLFAVKDQVKDQLAGKGGDLMPSGDRVETGRGDRTTFPPIPSEAERPRESERAAVVSPATETLVPPSDTPPSPASITQLRRPPAFQPSASGLHDPAPAGVGPLRIGMPRHLHERVRASAALACLPTTALVRAVLESATPHFDVTAPLADLTRVARSAFPEAGSGRRPIEVRMQVPMAEDLHRRLVQLAALRAQTLSVCLLDLLEDRLPR
jgi:hypothetical protein